MENEGEPPSYQNFIDPRQIEIQRESAPEFNLSYPSLSVPFYVQGTSVGIVTKVAEDNPTKLTCFQDAEKNSGLETFSGGVEKRFLRLYRIFFRE